MKTNGKCAYCGCDLDFNNFHLDHMIPKSKVSTDKIDSLIPSCVDCNLSKGNLTVDEFRAKIENMIFDKHIGRMVAKHYDVKPKKIVFHFEKRNCYGD